MAFQDQDTMAAEAVQEVFRIVAAYHGGPEVYNQEIYGDRSAAISGLASERASRQRALAAAALAAIGRERFDLARVMLAGIPDVRAVARVTGLPVKAPPRLTGEQAMAFVDGLDSIVPGVHAGLGLTPRR